MDGLFSHYYRPCDISLQRNFLFIHLKIVHWFHIFTAFTAIIFKRFIKWSEMGQQTAQGKKVYWTSFIQASLSYNSIHFFNGNSNYSKGIDWRVYVLLYMAYQNYFWTPVSLENKYVSGRNRHLMEYAKPYSTPKELFADIISIFFTGFR